MAENRKKNSDKKNNTGFAFAVWLLVALILLVLFFVERETIITNLKNTDFFGRVFGKTPEFIERHEVVESNESNGALQIDVLPAAEQGESSVSVSNVEQNRENEPLRTATEGVVMENITAGNTPTENQNEGASITQAQNAPASERIEPLPATETESARREPAVPASESAATTTNTEVARATVPTAETASASAPAAVPAKTNAQLCFITVSPSDGSVSRKIVTRELAKSDSPLTDAINALIAGPSSGDNSDGSVMSLIPDGTRLLGASVSNGIATLNFNEAFTFNAYGVQGYLAELMQVVYTATSFSTVNSVQFIIEGQREDYLGSEGTWIGSPLARSSFN